MLLMAIKIRNIITNTGKMNQMRTEKNPTWWDQNRNENGLVKILLITLRHINVLHEDITYIQYYMDKGRKHVSAC